MGETATLSVREIASETWAGARFYFLDPPTAAGESDSSNTFRLRDLDGKQSTVAEILDTADVAVMVLTSNDGADAARAIGQECSRRSIMTAGLIFAPYGEVDDALASLRPHARVIVVSRVATDVFEVLSALRS